MESGGPGSCDHVDLPAGASSELSVILAANHAELLDRIHTGILQQGQVCPAVDIISTIDGPIVLRCTAAVDGEIYLIGSTERVGHAYIQLVGCEIGGNPRREGYQLLVVAGIDGQFANLSSGDQPGFGGRL